MSITLSRFLAYSLTGVLLGVALWSGLAFDQFNTETTAFMISASLAGLALLVLIAFLPKGEALDGQGDATTPQASVFATDLVCLVAAALACFFIFDGYAEKFGFEIILADPLVADVIAFMYLPVSLFLAHFVSSLANQKIAIDGDGLTLSGLDGNHHAAWQDIRLIKPVSQHVLVSRVGLIIPKKLRTNMQITVKNGDKLTLLEPATSNIRLDILCQLKSHAPAHLQDQIEDVADSWI